MATPRTSAGILLYRRADELQVLLGHMGGPYYARKDDGAWSVPKGEYGPDEGAFAAALREFAEELGTLPPRDTERYLELGTIRQRNGKLVTAWAVEGDLDTTEIVSNTFELEWPPRSGRLQSFPEVDRAAWFDVATAAAKVVGGQAELFERLRSRLDALSRD